MNENKITAAYERLSVGDEQRSGESVSIQNQKLLLEQYARNHGFKHIVHYTEACDIIEPNPGSLATGGFQAVWSILYYALGLIPRPLISRT
jgi:hypothetical protein